VPERQSNTAVFEKIDEPPQLASVGTAIAYYLEITVSGAVLEWDGASAQEYLWAWR
jgi:hypothetical protein